MQNQLAAISVVSSVAIEEISPKVVKEICRNRKLFLVVFDIVPPNERPKDSLPTTDCLCGSDILGLEPVGAKN